MTKLTTKEVASKIHVPVSRLQFWVREGILTPAANGEGRQRRLLWGPQDIQDAEALKNGKGKMGTLQVLLEQAEALKTTVEPNEVIAAGTGGARRFPHDTPISEVTRRLGKIILLIA